MLWRRVFLILFVSGNLFIMFGIFLFKIVFISDIILVKNVILVLCNCLWLIVNSLVKWVCVSDKWMSLVGLFVVICVVNNSDKKCLIFLLFKMISVCLMVLILVWCLNVVEFE